MLQIRCFCQIPIFRRLKVKFLLMGELSSKSFVNVYIVHSLCHINFFVKPWRALTGGLCGDGARGVLSWGLASLRKVRQNKRNLSGNGLPWGFAGKMHLF